VIDNANNSSSPFLDMLESKKPGRPLDHTVYRKPTHKDICTSANSDHHHNRRAILFTVIGWAKTICNSLRMIKYNT
jgi:hypothetical protein